jgi:hypothetical protein
MTDAQNDWISARAYALWELDGQKHGKDVQHWQQAATEYERLVKTRASSDGSEVELARTKPRANGGKSAVKTQKSATVLKQDLKPPVQADA